MKRDVLGPETKLSDTSSAIGLRGNPQRPESATSGGVVVALTVAFFLGFFIISAFDPFESTVKSAIYLILIMTSAVVVTDTVIYKIHWKASTGLDHNKVNYSLIRCAIKISGLYGTIAIIAAFYFALPEYTSGLYKPFFDAASIVLLPYLLIAIPYVDFVDSRMSDPEDGYWHMGNIVLLRWHQADRSIAWGYFRSWLVKAFFLPLMFSYMCNDLAKFTNYEFVADYNFLHIYTAIFGFLFFIDVSAATLGYVCTFRVSDTHIRSAEPTTLGWVVALVCYVPFWPLIATSYFDYDQGRSWGEWLWDDPVLYGIWGVTILSLIAIYVSATLVFGGRFSNLTHRGIITNGPYRFTKNPAYISKNLAWWLLATPFIVHDGDVIESIRLCFLLLCVNGIYYLRARTEELHLSRDPVYVAYSDWIRMNGIFRFMPRFRLSRSDESK